MGGESYEELAPRNFSFNSPYGACAACDGLGTTFEVDPELVVPNPDLSVAEGAIAPWSTARTQYFSRMLEAVAEANDIDLDKPWAKLTKAQQNVLLYGAKGQVTVKYKNRYGRSGSTPPPTRASSRSSSGATATPRATGAASRSRATCARCRARTAAGPG